MPFLFLRAKERGFCITARHDEIFVERHHIKINNATSVLNEVMSTFLK
jgi:hypothetical protein